jgi:polysaccharide export outer membrane protein
MRHVILACGALVLILSSCVPNRKLVYLQKDDLKHREEIPKDTILRKHDLVIQEYRIQPLDILSINFESLSDDNDKFDFLEKLNPQRSIGGGGNTANSGILNGILVDAEGYIDYAVLGKFKISGLTLFQARDTLQKAAGKFVPDVVVRVRMLNFRYTVLGEVNGERTVVSQNTRLNMMEAIGQAGGLGELADRSHIKVIRQNGGQTEIFYVNLLDEKYVESPYYFVQQNDVIIVPPLKQRPFRKYFTANMAVIASTISLVLVAISLSR